jgi:uncharacterized protein YkwD
MSGTGTGHRLTRSLAALIPAALLALLVAAVISLAADRDAEAAGGGRVPECGGGEYFLRAEEKQMFELHNKERQARNLPTFCVDANLQEAAREHSEDMIRRDYISHDTKGRNEDFSERLRRYGYLGLPVGENITGGSGKAGEPGPSMNRWMKSQVHRNNILDPRFDEIGIGVAAGRFQKFYGWKMYTADFGGG